MWITGVWTFTIVAGTLTENYLGAQITSPVMIIMTGYYFGTEIVDRIRGRGEQHVNGSGSKEDRWSHMP